MDDQEEAQESKRVKKALLEEFPTYFAEYGGDPSETCMAWGFEIGNGWLPILWAACKSIDAHYWFHKQNKMREPCLEALQRYNQFNDLKTSTKEGLRAFREQYVRNNKHKVKEPLPPFRFLQVKEKYGSLELYHTPHSLELDAIIGFAHSMSSVTCETCGSTQAVHRSQGWITTKCRKCLSTDYDHMWKKAIRTTSEREKDKRSEP